MSAFQEVAQTVAFFAFAFIVIPVASFTAIIIRDYYRKEGKNNVEAAIRRHSKR